MSLSLLSENLQSPSSQQDQQPQPVCTWSAHTPKPGPSKSPFPRYYHALSPTATAAGELFFSGGYARDNPYTWSNDLYMISTRDFSTTLLQTSGEVPSPRGAHDAALTSTNLLIWGGNIGHINNPDGPLDDSLHLLNLGTSYFDVKIDSSSSECLVLQYLESGPASWPMAPDPAVVTTIP
jgi:hypothetical protein